jgi:hypothetical protein
MIPPRSLSTIGMAAYTTFVRSIERSTDRKASPISRPKIITVGEPGTSE